MEIRSEYIRHQARRLVPSALALRRAVIGISVLSTLGGGIALATPQASDGPPRTPDSSTTINHADSVGFNEQVICDRPTSSMALISNGRVLGCFDKTSDCFVQDLESRRVSNVDGTANASGMIIDVVGSSDSNLVFVVKENKGGAPFFTQTRKLEPIRVSGDEGTVISESTASRLNPTSLHILKGKALVLQNKTDGNIPFGYLPWLTIADANSPDLREIVTPIQLRPESGAIVGSVVNSADGTLFVSFAPDNNGAGGSALIAYSINKDNEVKQSGRPLNLGLEGNLIPQTMMSGALLTTLGTDSKVLRVVDVSTQETRGHSREHKLALAQEVRLDDEIREVISYPGEPYFFVLTGNKVIPFRLLGKALTQLGDGFDLGIKADARDAEMIDRETMIVATNEGLRIIKLDLPGSRLFVPKAVIEFERVPQP